MGGDLFENAPRVDADIFYTHKKDAFSKIWIRVDEALVVFHITKQVTLQKLVVRNLLS